MAATAGNWRSAASPPPGFSPDGIACRPDCRGRSPRRARRRNRRSASRSAGVAGREMIAVDEIGVRRRRRSRRAPDARARGISSFQPICGILSAGSAGSIATTSPAIQPSPSTVSNSRPRSAISCMPTQMPRNGRPRADHRLAERRLEAGHRGEAAPAIGEGADARAARCARRAATSSGRAGHDDVGRRCRSRAAARSNALAAERRLPEP